MRPPGASSALLAFKQIRIEVLAYRGLWHDQATDFECFRLGPIETVKSLRLLLAPRYQIIAGHRAVKSIVSRRPVGQ
jgi:hypothetical protein